jgi:predicted TIM-barrel fold metal-dependent hydrolase
MAVATDLLDRVAPADPAAPRIGAAGRSGAAATAIDCHAHVFERSLPLAATRRYSCAHDATPSQYLEMLDAHGLSHGVLVQPSFLGTDNRYMVAALQRHPERLRGVAVLPPDVAPDRLAALDEAGVVGLRLNLIGLPDPVLDRDPWPSLLRRIVSLDWQVEVHAEARRLPGVVGPLVRAGVRVVVDHFGRPDPAQGIDDPGFRWLLSAAASRRVWVKLSGAYRNGADGVGERTAAAAMPLLRDSVGPERLLWGSDWPHTQFEGVADCATARAQLETWLPDPEERKLVLVDTPLRLFRFEAEQNGIREAS